MITFEAGYWEGAQQSACRQAVRTAVDPDLEEWMLRVTDARIRWWAWHALVALVLAATALVAFAIGQPLAGVAFLLLAGEHVAWRHVQLMAFRDGWHTANCVPRSSRRPLEPWEPIPPPIYPEAPTQGSRWSVVDDGS